MAIARKGGAKGRGGGSGEWGSLKSGREVYPLGMPGAKSLCFKVVKSEAREKATTFCEPRLTSPYVLLSVVEPAGSIRGSARRAGEWQAVWWDEQCMPAARSGVWRQAWRRRGSRAVRGGEGPLRWGRRPWRRRRGPCEV